MSPPIMQNRKREHHLNKMKLALPLKQRLQIVADSSQDDSSSSDGTPQRRILLEDPRYEIELSTRGPRSSGLSEGRLSFLTLVYLVRLSFEGDYISRATNIKGNTVFR